MRDRHIFKILTVEQWNKFKSEGAFQGSPVDLEDGYIHLSRASQIKATLDKWYGEYARIVILEIDSQRVDSDLKYEISRGGAEFPHLFTVFPLKAVGKIWEISPENGQYNVPLDLKAN